MKEATFSLKGYAITKAVLNLEGIPASCTFNLDFEPSGVYESNSGCYTLSLIFKAKCDNGIEAINIKVQATYQFKEILNFNEIPPYFYSNSIAIIFPYIRAFVSTITLQANVSPIMLPTLNISALEDVLKSNTIVKNDLLDGQDSISNC